MVDKDTAGLILQSIAEVIERAWAIVPNCEPQDKVEILERLMAYCSQQRNHFVREIVDTRPLEKK
jgi:hypothetical protein